MFKNRPAMQQTERPRRLHIVDELVEFMDSKEDMYRVRAAIQQRLLSEVDDETILEDPALLNQIIEDYFNQYLQENNLLFPEMVRNQLLDWVVADILSYGPLEPLLSDPEVTEIMVNGPNLVYIEKAGKIEETDVTFEDDQHLRRIIDRIVAPIGRRVDESSPMVDARLPSGYRVNATIPPLSLDGPILTIRKFAQTPFTAQDLVVTGSLTQQFVDFLHATVEARINIIISGGTGSGKTTLLNIASTYIPSNERILTIESTAELQLKQKHVVRLEERPPNIEGQGEVTTRSLVINAMRMRPDRIIVGESRGGEALDMLQAMNTGHDGSMTTVHSNGARDTLRRIETMVLMAGMDLPLQAIREQVSSAIDLIIHVERMKDGGRRVVQVAEVMGMEQNTIVMQDLFKFELEGYVNEKIIGQLQPTGLWPSFMEKLELNDFQMPEDTFRPL